MVLCMSRTLHKSLSRTHLQMVTLLKGNKPEASMLRIKMLFLLVFKLLRNSLFLKLTLIGSVEKAIKHRHHAMKSISEQDLLSMVLRLPSKTLIQTKNTLNTLHSSNDQIWHLKE